MRKKFTPLPERRADSSARPCSDCLALTWLGEPKCLYGEKLVQLGRWPYHRKRVTRLLAELMWKSWLAQGSSGRRVTLLTAAGFLHIFGAFISILYSQILWRFSFIITKYALSWGDTQQLPSQYEQESYKHHVSPFTTVIQCKNLYWTPVHFAYV